jgi:hypothetical protein
VRFLAIGLLFIVGCLAEGCTIDLKNQGEVGFRYGHEITFFHRAAKTSDEAARSSIETSSLTEYIWKPRDEPVGPPAPG